MKQRAISAAIAAALTFSTALAVKWEVGAADVPLRAYKPIPTDPWTICLGHTRGVYEGMTATREQCDAWLMEDQLEANDAIDRCIHWPLTSNVRGALIDATLNIGPKVVCGSTLQRLANAGDIRGACRELTHARNARGEARGWAYSAGQWMRGLFARRVDEAAICWPDFSNVRGGAL